MYISFFIAVFHSFIAAEGTGGERLNGEIIKWQISTFSFNKLAPNGSRPFLLSENVALPGAKYWINVFPKKGFFCS